MCMEGVGESDTLELRGTGGLMACYHASCATQRAGLLKRLDDVTLELTLPQFAAYEIAFPETIDVRVPGAAVRSRQPPSLVAPLVVMATPGSASVGGSLKAHS